MQKMINNSIEFIKKFKTSDEFIEFMKNGIDGLDVSAILGKNKFNTKDDIWKNKRGVSKRLYNDIHAGNFFERFIIDYCVHEKGLELIKSGKIFYDLNNPWMRGNIDALAKDKDDRLVGIETKTALLKNKIEWVLQIPIEYQYQCWWYGTILGVEDWYIPVFFIEYNGIGDPIVKEKEIYLFNINQISHDHDSIIDIIKKFWESVINNEFPESLYTFLELSDDMQSIINEYKRLCQLEDNICKLKHKISNKFKQIAKDKCLDNNKEVYFIDSHHQKIASVVKVVRKSFNPVKFFAKYPNARDYYKKCQKESKSLMFRLINLDENKVVR